MSVDVLNDLPEDREIKSILEKNYFPNPLLGAPAERFSFLFHAGRLVSADIAKFPNTLTQVHKNFFSWERKLEGKSFIRPVGKADRLYSKESLISLGCGCCLFPSFTSTSAKGGT